MPPRKSTSSSTAHAETNGDVSMVSNASTTTTTTHAHPAAASHPKSSRQSGGHKQQQDDGVSIDDLLLPRSLVSRLARGVLPANTSIQKDATLALAKSATVFISYLAHHANEQTTKKTVSPQDVIKALEQIEMGAVMGLGATGPDGRRGGRLERELEAYEEHIRGKRKGYRDKVKAREGVGDGQNLDRTVGAGAAGADDEDEEERGEPSNKKARRMSAEEEEEDDDDETMLLEAQLNGGNAVRTNGDDDDDDDDDHDEGENDADQDEEDEVEDEDEDEDEDDDEEEEEEGEEGEEEQDADEEAVNDADELEGRDDRRNHTNGRRIALMPDGNVDMSGDESD
ncbi:hypothetical protein PV08_07817 [Exophiala spinifera]|uniref:DNA polymerase epsilon subunit D n=1 Tax=Exophiala spinifera TaxID=91928 RepID=A0A0D2B8R3_9EURO|nr:uncharacterized protein PV08_07817 [Exophiala spinifera]KIW15030.1 hypothetical protein PV08_07817 [Exophiala spinifera]